MTVSTNGITHKVHSTMEARLRQRLDELQAEYGKGKKSLEELETQTVNLRATLLRISGAIQILQEELGRSEEVTHPQMPD